MGQQEKRSECEHVEALLYVAGRHCNLAVVSQKQLREYLSTVWDRENADALGRSNMRSFIILNNLKIRVPSFVRHTNNPGSSAPTRSADILKLLFLTLSLTVTLTLISDRLFP